MGRKELLLTGLLGLLTASAAPWWWNRAFGDGKSGVPPAPQAATPAVPTVPVTAAPAPAIPEAGPVTGVTAPVQVAVPATDCEGKWYLQMSAGQDREGLKGVTDKIRAAGGAFSAAVLYTASDGKYRVVLGCFDRFRADNLKDEFVSKKILATTPLVTRGESLRAKVY